MLMEDEIQEDFLINRDLSTWRIEIPSIELMRREDLANKSSTSERVYAFYIEIKRVDVQEGEILTDLTVGFTFDNLLLWLLL